MRSGSSVAAYPCDPKAGSCTPPSKPGDDTGVVVTAGHIHLALRELAGVSEGAPAQKFKLAGDNLPFFG